MADRKPNADPEAAGRSPIVVSQWPHGVPANAAALEILGRGGSALDAVEAAVATAEEDPEVTSVGYGGLPDAEGRMTLDACIMDHRGECGSVAAIEEIINPIKVARKVMEETPHVMLVGPLATKFAVAHGFRRQNLLTPAAKAEWEKWKAGQAAKEGTADLHHDTIGTLAIDAEGRMAGACTTSGWAFKVPGRVGDSPIIGAGMFCDDEVGAAAATGAGEEVIKVCGSFAVVENMRHGMSPQAAIEDVLRRIAKRRGGDVTPLVGFIALRRDGIHGAASLSRRERLTYAVGTADRNELAEAPFVFE